MFKKLSLLFILALTFFVAFPLNVSKAAELDNSDTNVIEQTTEDQITEEQITSPYFINDFRSRKKNVSYSESWSGYKRISDDLNTNNSSGGTLTATTTASFGVTVSGSIEGLGISTSTTLTSAKSYSLSVPKNKIVYMGYRVLYKVETGTREYYDLVTGKVISSNKYTVKTPIKGEYKLIDTK